MVSEKAQCLAVDPTNVLQTQRTTATNSIKQQQEQLTAGSTTYTHMDMPKRYVHG